MNYTQKTEFKRSLSIMKSVLNSIDASYIIEREQGGYRLTVMEYGLRSETKYSGDVYELLSDIQQVIRDYRGY